MSGHVYWANLYKVMLYFCSKVKVLYKFSQMGHMDHPQSSERLNKLLVEVLLVAMDELPLLQYWRSALNKEYKTHLIKAERS